MTQSTAAVANTVPWAGPVIGTGMTYSMFGQWGYSGTQTTTAVLVSGVWNSLAKLGLPVLALALLALEGGASRGRVVAGLVAAQLKLDAGGTLQAHNRGGEDHSFTEVANFGGGCIAALNELLGLTPVPECAGFPGGAFGATLVCRQGRTGCGWPTSPSSAPVRATLRQSDARSMLATQIRSEP